LKIFHVKLTPKAAADRIGAVREGMDGQNILPVYVTAVPEDGKANEAMIRLLAKHLGVAPSHVIIRKGHTSRHKVIEVQE